MCLGIPARITDISEDGMGCAEVGGVSREISLQLIENPKIGEWVLLHAGFAINRIDHEEARKTLKLLEEIGGLS